jgi:hypothetical protein
MTEKEFMLYYGQGRLKEILIWAENPNIGIKLNSAKDAFNYIVAP